MSVVVGGKTFVVRLTWHLDYSKYFIRLKPGVSNMFVLRILVSPEYVDLIRGVCVGGIDKRQLNKEHIEDFPIICPPTDMVNEYVKFVCQVDKSKLLSLIKLLE